MKSIKITLLLSAFVMLVAVGCKKDKDEDNGETTSLSVRMTDAPGCFDATYINLREVIVSYVGGKEVVLHTFAGIYDLVKLMNGVNVQIASGTLPSGQIEYIRLKLGDNNSATVDGVVFQLATPGEHHPGLKIPVSKNLVTGGSEEVLIDFDLFRSVVEQSNGSWQFNPVIRLVDKAVHESASGLITPASATSAIVFNSNGQRYASFSND